MARTQKKKLTDQLPATSVTPEMKQAVIDLAITKGVSVASIQREAIAFFFEKNYSSAIVFNN